VKDRFFSTIQLKALPKEVLYRNNPSWGETNFDNDFPFQNSGPAWGEKGEKPGKYWQKSNLYTFNPTQHPSQTKTQNI